MIDAFKILRRKSESFDPESASNGETQFSAPVQKPAQEPIASPGHSAYKPAQESLARRADNNSVSPATRALNKWLSQRKDRGIKGLVNILNETLVSQFGPLKLKGNLTLIHEDGTAELANQLSLCRCGHSRNKPFCDDQHIEKEFMDSGRFAQGSQSSMPIRPTSIAITCIQNGPLQFNGSMRIHDYLGQDCVKTRGQLCRCGQSKNKPFCDGSHEKTGFSSTCHQDRKD